MNRAAVAFLVSVVASASAAEDSALTAYQEGREQYAAIYQAAALARVRWSNICDTAPREGEDTKFCYGKAVIAGFLDACATVDDPVDRLACFDMVADQNPRMFLR